MSASGSESLVSLVGEHVAQVVEGHGVGGIQVQHLAEELLGGLVVLLPLGQLAAHKEQVGAVVFLGRKRLCLGKASSASFQRWSWTSNWLRRIHTARSLSVLSSMPLTMAMPSSLLPCSTKCSGEHHLHVRILGIGIGGLASDLDGFVEHLGLAVGLNLQVRSRERLVAAHVDHLLVSGDGLVGLVLLDGRPRPAAQGRSCGCSSLRWCRRRWRAR